MAAIEVKDIHKKFILPQTKNSSIKHAFVNIVKRNKKTIQKVLDGVSFTVEKGDFFGVVGRNGSGKSTLLKLLAGVYTPTSGEVLINGKLTPFIELGVGFNPELSGRDNVFLNGALLGFTHKEMEAMYGDIVAFAELEPFMDQKLKNYSSGMQVRLAFSVAIRARSDIMVFDEVLAVGDEAFQRKCLDVFERYKAEGQTVILVTHDMATVERFCNKAVLVNDGKIIESGDARLVARRYSQLNNQAIDKSELERVKLLDEIFDITLKDTSGKPCNRFQIGETVRVEVRYKLDKDLESIGINLFKRSGEHITGRNSRYERPSYSMKNKSFAIEYVLHLAPGKYFIYPEAFLKRGQNDLVEIDGPGFTVEGDRDWSGLVPLEYSATTCAKRAKKT